MKGDVVKEANTDIIKEEKIITSSGKALFVPALICLFSVVAIIRFTCDIIKDSHILPILHNISCLFTSNFLHF